MFPPDTRILIIDDMISIRTLVKRTLQSLNLNDIKEAADGESGLRAILKASSEGKPFQLIISDWKMPQMSGLDLLKHLRSLSEYSKLPFVLLTSESEKDQVTEAVLSGASQYVVKPFSLNIFQQKLQAAYIKHYGKS